MRCPAAPYCEQAVRDAAERICSESGLNCRRDELGNVWVHLKTNPRLRPLVLAAHLDHPAFKIIRRVSPDRLLAQFRGGVPDQYFRPRTRLRLMPGGETAHLAKRIAREKQFRIQASKPLSDLPQFAVWDLPDFSLRDGEIHGRACDDLIGVAAILAALIELKKTRARVNVIGLLTRAEEVGFHGALALAYSGKLPKRSLVISLETSREIPPVKMGAGVIIRVGDRTSIFDSEATRFLSEVAGGLARADETFAFQRALMSGGTCEATAFQEFGYQTAAVCVALGNYHNCAQKNRIAPEYVSVADCCRMARLMTAAARNMPDYLRLVGALPKRLAALSRSAKVALPQRP